MCVREKKIMNKLYPSTKFTFVALVIIISMFAPGYYLQYSLFIFILLLSLLSRKFIPFLSIFFKSIFWVLAFIFIFQVLIIRNPDSQRLWWIFAYSKMGLESSLLMTSKIAAISSAIIYFFQVTEVKDINHAMEKSGVPKKVTFVIASTIQLIPQMSNLSKTISDAQRSRGIETEGSLIVRMKSFFPMIAPLVLSSIQQTEERVLTLESRAFSSKRKKTAFYKLDKTKADYFLTLLFLIILAGFIIWRNR